MITLIGRALMVAGVLACVLPSLLIAGWFFSDPTGLPHAVHHLMWVVPVGLLLVVVAVRLQPPKPPARPPRPRRPGLLVAVLFLMMIIDISKQASIGFVMPGMRQEYGLSAGQVALLPVSSLVGAALASVVCGWLAERYGTRTIVVLSGVLFTGTALCGVMQGFTGNLLMCFLMGATAGGLVPVVFALVAWVAPPRWVTPLGALLAGVGATGGYALASTLSAWLIPLYGWRAVWVSGAITGLVLLLCCPLVPDRLPARARAQAAPSARADTGRTARRTSLTVYGLFAGVLALGYLTWLPSMLRTAGLSGDEADRLLSTLAWLTLPIVVGLALALSVWRFGTCLLVVAVAGALLVPLSAAALALEWPVLALSLTVGGVVLVANTMIAATLSISSTWNEDRDGAFGLGVVAGASKAGGLVGPPLVGAASGAPATFILIGALLGGGTLASGVFLRRTTGKTREHVAR